MPSFVKTTQDEERWKRAKKIAADQGKTPNDGDTYWALVNHVFQNMKGSVKKAQDPLLLQIAGENFFPREDRIPSFLKSDHIDDSKKRALRSAYHSGKYSLRELADKAGVSKHQAEDATKGVSSPAKTSEGMKKHQSEHARWRGKKLPESIVQANHEGRNKAIEARPATSMEKPVENWLHKHGVKYHSQVEVSELTGVNDAEAGIVDFVVGKTVIQADGPRHTLTNVKERVAKQDTLLRAHGYRLIHIDPKHIDHLDQMLGSLA